MNYILALDQGTTSSRALIFDRAGRICAVAQEPLPQHFPQPGWVEHDASDIWQGQLATARAALAQAGLQASDIAAIGIANQRETTLLWERASGQPLAPAIVWQDRRTAAHCERLRLAGHEPLIQQKTGLLLDAYFSATKLAWLLDNIPGARQRAERGELAFGTVDSWLVWQLTGGQKHVTDVSNAARTLLLNLHTLDWDDELLALFGVPRGLLPQVVASSGELGTTEASLFGAAIPIAGLAGDQQAALFGQACHSPGMAKNTYGTGCFMLLHTGAQAVPSHNKLLTTAACALPQQKAYALEGAVFNAGATVQWLRDGLGIIGAAAEIEPLAASVPDCGDVFLVPAFTGLGAPWWDPHARAALLGLTRGSNRAHIARAALESIALQCADVFAAMTQDAGCALAELRVDGGASGNDLLMQMQADFLGVAVVRPRITETTALGAAYLAGLAVGFWRDTAEIAAQWQAEPALSRNWHLLPGRRN